MSDDNVAQLQLQINRFPGYDIDPTGEIDDATFAALAQIAPMIGQVPELAPWYQGPWRNIVPKDLFNPWVHSALDLRAALEADPPMLDALRQVIGAGATLLNLNDVPETITIKETPDLIWATPDPDGGTNWLPWILLGLVVVGGLYWYSQQES